MAESKIGILGMCNNDCQPFEGVTLPDGEWLHVSVCKTGRACVALDGLAARYEADELSAIGFGNEKIGLTDVIREVRTSPGVFQHGQIRPLEDRL